MKIGVAGSVGKDHLMTFEGKFKDSIVDGALTSVSLSFLVDSLEIRRGGCAANISFGMGALGLTPILIAAVGKDWPDYDTWLKSHGVDTSHVQVSKELYTATFMVTTDLEHNQIASFFPGAMSEAREIQLLPIVKKVGFLDLLIISPDDPESMVQYSQTARESKIAFAADPSQQLARMNGPEIKQLIQGAKYLFLNEYELALTLQKTGWTDEELFNEVQVRITTLGAKGARIEEHGKETVNVGVPKELSKIDPTGVGDNFRSGFLAGLSWGMSHERCAQIGSLLATYCLENKGTQEYKFTKEEFMSRFIEAYGQAAGADIQPHLHSRVENR